MRQRIDQWRLTASSSKSITNINRNKKKYCDILKHCYSWAVLNIFIILWFLKKHSLNVSIYSLMFGLTFVMLPERSICFWVSAVFWFPEQLTPTQKSGTRSPPGSPPHLQHLRQGNKSYIIWTPHTFQVQGLFHICLMEKAGVSRNLLFRYGEN